MSEDLLKRTNRMTGVERSYIAPNATIVGDVTLGDDVTILFGAVLRADLAPIVIGNRSNVQDNAIIHGSTGRPTIVGSNVSIGHGAIIHGCTIEDNCLIGMGAIILNQAVIGHGSLVAAGALISERKIIPPHSLVMGIPGKVIRELTPDETLENLKNVDTYVNIGREYQNK